MFPGTWEPVQHMKSSINIHEISEFDIGYAYAVYLVFNLRYDIIFRIDPG